MSTWRRLKIDGRTYLGKYPRVFLPMLAFRRRNRVVRHWLSPQIFGPDTELVVEGFPRSGNTFSVSALYVATNHKLPKLAHHIHVPAQIIQAIRHGKPAIALIRDPLDAMASSLVYNTSLGPKQVLRAYVHFYEPLIPYKRELVIAPFETVVGNFGNVITALNDLYGTSIPKFDHTEASVKTCFDLIDEKNQLYTGEIKAHAVARPSTDRKQLNQDARRLLKQPAYSKMLHRAERLYASFRESAVPAA